MKQQGLDKVSIPFSPVEKGRKTLLAVYDDRVNSWKAVFLNFLGQYPPSFSITVNCSV